MAYEDYENSVHDGQPVELYKFQIGSDYYYYTSANVNIPYDLQTYEPAYIERDQVEQTGDKIRNEMNIKVRRNNTFAQLFIAAAPEEPIYFTLYRGHEDTFVTFWVGSVLGVSFDTDDAIITIGPPWRGGRMSGLRRKFQKQCIYPLYGFQCGVNSSLFRITGTVNAINGKVLTVNAFNPLPAGWFKGGKFKSGVTQRMITAHSGTQITLTQGVNLVKVGDSCTGWAGCKHNYADCNDKFNNRINYGGQPWIPTRNPFGGDGVT